MSAQINDLIAMRDVESLLDILEDADDWMLQLDAAEGLVKLGERGGLDFLLSALQSDSDEVQEYAKGILNAPAVRQKRDDMDAESRRRHADKVKGARVRVQKGRKVYIYKSLFLPLGEILGESVDGEAMDIPALDDVGLEGWEVVNFIPKRGALLVSNADQHFTGAYFILRKEITADDIAELDTK